MHQLDSQSNTDTTNFESAVKQGIVEGAEAQGPALQSAELSCPGGDAMAEDASKGARKYPRAHRHSEPVEAQASATAACDEPPDDLPEVSRKVRRRRRRTRPRSKTIAMKRLTREELRIGALLYPPVDIERPHTRAECSTQSGPCPWVACKHHLYLDVNPETGSIKLNFPDLEPWELEQTCALEVAERGGITLEEVGEIMNLTRERIRQVEVRGLRKIRASSPSPEEIGALVVDGRQE